MGMFDRRSMVYAIDFIFRWVPAGLGVGINALKSQPAAHAAPIDQNVVQMVRIGDLLQLTVAPRTNPPTQTAGV